MQPWDADKPSDDELGKPALVAVEPCAPQAMARPDFVLQPRDLELFAYVARHGVCSSPQLQRRFWSDSHINGTYARLEKLVSRGYLVADRTWYRGPTVFRVTRAALRAASLSFFPTRLNWARLHHQLSVVDLSETLLAAHSGSTWRTERELRQDWLSDRARGVEHKRLPDGMLLHDGRRTAVELELSDKRAPDYRALGDAYLDELILGIDDVWWFAASDRIAELLHRFFAPMYGDNPWKVELWAAS